ncbi:MAG: hypothetical protein K8R99_00630 [Actinomycetia bacterium]|nr:hypothetical protein [Actinomycetes bacterium]
MTGPDFGDPALLVSTLAVVVTMGTFWWDKLRKGRLRTVKPLRVRMFRDMNNDLAPEWQIEFWLTLFVRGQRPVIVRDLAVSFEASPTCLLSFVAIDGAANDNLPLVLQGGATLGMAAVFTGRCGDRDTWPTRVVVWAQTHSTARWRRLDRLEIPSNRVDRGGDWTDIRVGPGWLGRLWLRLRA